jgi:phytanoyl-CoA hydroxylase
MLWNDCAMADTTTAADYAIAAPHGGMILIPARVEPGTDPYLRMTSAAQRRAYYEEHGYVVIRGLASDAACDAARAAYEREVKSYPGFLYRQATANPEKHVLTTHGHVLNSLLNIQDFDARRFPHFRAAGLDVITSPTMRAAVEGLLGEPGRVVQSMYFEGNPVTWAHQDTYYLDGEPLGSMTAAWIALEDVHPGAGRFYVYPGSHRIDMARNGGDFDIAFHHDRYKTLVIDVVKKFALQCQAPALNKGDVLFWSSKTIHGSLGTPEPAHSRSSITCHFIPASGRFMQYQTRARQMRLERVNDMDVHCPKSQGRLLNRAAMAVEVNFPGAFQLAKRLAVKAFTR